MKLLLIAILFVQSVFARTEVIDKASYEQNGDTFYILTICRDGLQYSMIYKGELINLKVLEDTIYNEDTKKVEQIGCQFDFKHESQLIKE